MKLYIFQILTFLIFVQKINVAQNATPLPANQSNDTHQEYYFVCYGVALPPSTSFDEFIRQMQNTKGIYVQSFCPEELLVEIFVERRFFPDEESLRSFLEKSFAPMRIFPKETNAIRQADRCFYLQPKK